MHYPSFLVDKMNEKLEAFSKQQSGVIEPDYKDLLRRYALHVGEFAETTYTEPNLSYNHITKEEAEFINKLIEQ